VKRKTTRREFLQQSAFSAAGLCIAGRRAFAEGGSPNEKLGVAVIGVAGQGEYNLNNVASQAIVALCDVDENRAANARKRFPNAKFYTDFRRVLDQKDIDAVVVATPDHTHAPATMMALKAGKHVYCEKPLTHSVVEARMVARTAAKMKRVTQMGTQIHAGSNYRRVVELVQSGAVGPIGEVHVWCGSVWTGGGDRPADTPPVPAGLHYDLWIGPAPYRPYHPKYIPAAWRGWWDFGGGALTDMACHYTDLPFWALDLRHPLTVESEGPPVHPESAPAWLIVRYEYPARKEKPPVKLTWYNGDKRPPHMAEGKIPSDWGSGVLFIGQKGMLLADYNRHVLLPEKDFADFKKPAPFIPESIGHHNEWIEACKTGGKTTCNFDYSGALTEAVLLGNVSYRSGTRVQWDAENLKVTNSAEAMKFLERPYREGWTL
jgi:predicted dehydrogenase